MSSAIEFKKKEGLRESLDQLKNKNTLSHKMMASV